MSTAGRPPRRRIIAALLLAGGLSCASDGASPTDAAQPRHDAARADAAAADAPIGDASPADAGAAADRSADRDPVADCAALGASECFANVECAADRRCENVGTQRDPLACCVPGARGTGAAGTPCDDENACASAVCVAGNGPALCSRDCASAADCPAGMQRCIPIAMSGSPLKWCFPES